ncbi:MAG: hypothetical protein OK454_12265, partial [Thaumarchaeota archaeon]|nr:hypothetical protein [Nitrososphaerota archaeon]
PAALSRTLPTAPSGPHRLSSSSDTGRANVAARPTLLLLQKDGDGHSSKLLLAVEAGDFEDEEVADQFSAQLLDELPRGSSGSA